MKIALVCIAKDEDNYIEEWINYHFKLGFDKIFIYENNWRCKLDIPNVVKIPFDGELKQVEAYNSFLKNYKSDFDWVGFIDVDEFLVLSEDKIVKDFFNRFNKMPGVAVNWFLFGDNSLERVENNEFSLIKRFTKRQSTPNDHIKSFINLKVSESFVMNVHNPSMKISNQEFELFNGPFCKNCSTKYAQINHYFCKTIDEFKLKVEKGRADVNLKRNYNEHSSHNFNEVEDYHALNFMYK
jgi:hypothetical protein